MEHNMEHGAQKFQKMEIGSRRHTEEIHQHSQKVRDGRNMRKRGTQMETCGYTRTPERLGQRGSNMA